MSCVNSFDVAIVAYLDGFLQNGCLQPRNPWNITEEKTEAYYSERVSFPKPNINQVLLKRLVIKLVVRQFEAAFPHYSRIAMPSCQSS